MNTVDILKAAKQLLVDKGWTQGAMARDSANLPLASTAPGAACYCGIGALRSSRGAYAGPKAATQVAYHAARHAIMDAAGTDWFPNFNDAPGRTVDEVLAVFDKAIAAEEARVAPEQ